MCRPAPSNYLSHSLIELLNQISPGFKRNFAVLQKRRTGRHPFERVATPYQVVTSDNDHSVVYAMTQSPSRKSSKQRLYIYHSVCRCTLGKRPYWNTLWTPSGQRTPFHPNLATKNTFRVSQKTKELKQTLFFVVWQSTTKYHWCGAQKVPWCRCRL